jgi:hypothetical protein
MKQKLTYYIGEVIQWIFIRFTKLVDGFIGVAPYCFLICLVFGLIIGGIVIGTLAYDFTHNFKH